MTPEVGNENPKTAILNYLNQQGLDGKIKYRLKTDSPLLPKELFDSVLEGLQNRATELEAQENKGELGKIEELYNLIENNYEDFLEAAEEIGCVDPEKKLEADKEKITKFYNSRELEALYKQAQALKGEGERVKAEDVGALLQKGSADEQDLYALLMSEEHKEYSQMLWEQSDIRRKAKEAFEGSELKDIAEFFKDLSDIPPEDQNDVKKLIEAFEQKFPKYKDKVDTKWYQEQFKEQIDKMKAPELKTLQDFYNGDDFKKLYNEVSANLGQAPVWTDILKALKANGHDNIVMLATKHEAESIAMWNVVWKQAKEAFEAFEKTEFDAFSDKLTAKDFADIDKTAEAFQKTRKRYAGAPRLEWYKKQLEFKKRFKQSEWKEDLNKFYQTDLDAIYAEVASSQNTPPRWQDIKAKLEARGDADTLYILENVFKTESEAAWKQFWEQKEIEFNQTETNDLNAFKQNLKVADWQNLDATVAKFQATKPKYSGEAKANWYKGELSKELPAKQAEWKQTLDSFYQTKLPGLYEAVALEKGKAPAWQDIKAKLTALGDTDTLYILENVYKTESEAQWKTYWENQKETFNTAEEKAADSFFKGLAPADLDNTSAIKARFSSETSFNANNEWFEGQLNKFLAKKKTELEDTHQNLVNTLPDSALANAMNSAFKDAKTFAERAQWLQENKSKVAEYTSLINQNQALESRLNNETERHPDLKKKFNQLKEAYAQGKTNYANGFYSPRKYHEALGFLSLQLQERESLVSRTVDSVKQKSLRDVPELPKKETSLEQFRDALKAKKFYGLDEKARKDERVREAIKDQNKTLHQQWKTAREQYLSKEQKTKLEQATQTINRVKLPAKMPTGLDTYEAFTEALKSQKIYSRLTPGQMKNESVRQIARDHNQVLFAQYQAEQSEILDTEKKTNPVENVDSLALKNAEKTIQTVQLSPALQAKISERLPANLANDPNQFTIALRDLNVYQGVEPALLKNESVRQIARQHNQVLQQQYVANLDKAPLASVKNGAEQTEDKENNYGLPGHYKIDWDSFETNTNPTERKRALERFKQMHGRSEIGLQTVMQQFHQPLGAFILQTLAVMPQDRYDKALNALKDVRVETGKREQTSNWLKVLCENAGLDFLEKEASGAWNQLKQNFSTHFGTSLNKAWEVAEETPAIETEVSETVAPDEPSDLVETLEAEAPEEDKSDTTTATSKNDDQDDDVLVETEPDENVTAEESENTEEEEALNADDTDMEADLIEPPEAEVTTEETEIKTEDSGVLETDIEPNLEAGDLEVTDKAVDETDITEADLMPDTALAEDTVLEDEDIEMSEPADATTEGLEEARDDDIGDRETKDAGNENAETADSAMDETELNEVDLNIDEDVPNSENIIEASEEEIKGAPAEASDNEERLDTGDLDIPANALDVVDASNENIDDENQNLAEAAMDEDDLNSDNLGAESKAETGLESDEIINDQEVYNDEADVVEKLDSDDEGLENEVTETDNGETNLEDLNPDNVEAEAEEEAELETDEIVDNSEIDNDENDVVEDLDSEDEGLENEVTETDNGEKNLEDLNPDNVEAEAEGAAELETDEIVEDPEIDNDENDVIEDLDSDDEAIENLATETDNSETNTDDLNPDNVEAEDDGDAELVIEDIVDDRKVENDEIGTTPDTAEANKAAIEVQEPEVIKIPEIIVAPMIEAKEKEEKILAALGAWQQFTESNLPSAAAQEASDLKKQFSEILKSGFDDASMAKLKASGTWEKLMASPAHQQLLRTHLKQHQALSNEGLHFFTALQQELFFSRSLTVRKFLEQLKSYVQFTRELKATITSPSADQELSRETAAALFKAFASKYHSTSAIDKITLGFSNQTLIIYVTHNGSTKPWHFSARESEEA
jgi:hypothetical protein